MAGERMGLSLKFNIFIIALVVATALGVAAFVTYRQLGDKYQNLLLHGQVIADMAAQGGEYAVYTRSGEELTRQLNYLQKSPDVVYAAFLDRGMQPLAQRVYRDGVTIEPPQLTTESPLFLDFLFGPKPTSIVDVSAPIIGGGTEGEGALFLDMNQQVGELLGYVRVGLSLESFHKDAIHSLRSALWITLAMLPVGVAITMAMTRRIISPLRRLAIAAHDIARGRLVPVEVESSSLEIRELTDAFNTMTERLSAYRRDVESYQDILERKAYVDELTGLANRVLLKDHISLGLARAMRERKVVALLFLDLDRFKNVNDSLGHSLGDHLLKDVAERLRGCVSEQDTVGRMGGDEFVVVLTDLAPQQAREMADQVAQKIGSVLADTFKLRDYEVSASFSIGIALYPQDAGDMEELLKNADAAMYDAKANGRNTHRFYRRELSHGGIRRLTLESAMRRSLEREEFELYFQPQYCHEEQRVIGAEALLRWRRDGDTVSPSEFVPLAEETGLILPLGEWVMERACAIRQEWQSKGYCGPHGFRHIAVNVSAQQFWHPGFVSKSLKILDRAGELGRGGLEMELTESCLMHHSGDIMRTFSQLREAGIQFAVDDFGTGYSSLSYLKKFPLDVLKIDQSFVRECTGNSGDAAIVRAIIAMAKGLGLKVIAEGVETSEQAEFLTQHACVLFQGYYFGRPLPAREFERQWLAESSPTLWDD